MIAAFPPVTYPYWYWYIYDEDDYNGKMDALDVYSVYTAETNKVSSNKMYSRHYEN